MFLRSWKIKFHWSSVIPMQYRELAWNHNGSIVIKLAERKTQPLWTAHHETLLSWSSRIDLTPVNTVSSVPLIRVIRKPLNRYGWLWEVRIVSLFFVLLNTHVFMFIQIDSRFTVKCSLVFRNCFEAKFVLIIIFPDTICHTPARENALGKIPLNKILLLLYDLT